MADDGELVVSAEVDDPVVAPEGPEEGDLELGVGGLVDHARPALHRGDRTVQPPLVAAIPDADLAVFALRVGGLRGGAALLKTLREAGNLEPGTGVAVEVDLGDGL